MQDPLVTPLIAVCTLDRSIDRIASNVEKYADTRDIKHLRFVPGRVPFVFHMRPIGVHMMTSYVDAPNSIAEKYRRAFQVSVEKIENVPDGYGNLRTYLPTQPFQMPEGEVIVVDDKDMGKLVHTLGGLAFVYELGLAAYERAHLGKALDDGEVSWSLPPSSHAALARMKLRHAERIQQASATTSTASSPSAAPPSSDPPSAPRSDAGAAASGGTSSAAG